MSILHDMYNTLKSALSDGTNLDVGVCHLLTRENIYSAVKPYLYTCFESWPEWSGCFSYPISVVKDDSWTDGEQFKAVYDSSRKCKEDHCPTNLDLVPLSEFPLMNEYRQARIRLAKHILTCLEADLGLPHHE